MSNQSPEISNDTLQTDVETIGRIALRLSCAARRQLAQELSAFHLTVPQFMTMVAIVRHGGGCTMSELAEAAHQVSATMTGIIDRLVERQLVERQRDPADRRSFRVFLTASGEQLLDEVEQQKRARLLRTLKTLSPHDRKEMLRLMQIYLGATLAEVDNKESMSLS